MSPTTDTAERMWGSNANELVLVLDAGGSKTAAWLTEFGADTQHRILGRGRSTAGNPTSVGFQGATRAIVEAIDQCRRDAGRLDGPIARAVLSIAGALDPRIRSQFIEWARANALARDVAVVPDPLPVLAAGTPHCSGIALICGTGSSAFGRSNEGRTKLCGGWGYLLGDEGSGFAIGREALRIALADEERQASPRPLTLAVLQLFRSGTALAASKAVYRSDDPRAAIASAAPLVIEAAEAGDAQAVELIDAAARDLAALVSRAAAAVGLANSMFSLAVTGGVIVASQRMRDQLGEVLQADRVDCDIGVVDEPLEGCLRLAETQFSAIARQWQK
jgi:glucosamine kinase